VWQASEPSGARLDAGEATVACPWLGRAVDIERCFGCRLLDEVAYGEDGWSVECSRRWPFHLWRA
jgi:hypothetical protein